MEKTKAVNRIERHLGSIREIRVTLDQLSQMDRIKDAVAEATKTQETLQRQCDDLLMAILKS